MVALYARVSTEEQAKNGYSLMDQIRECKKLAAEETVIEYIDDGYSGEILDRPALSALRRDVRKGLITKVICLDPDRLSRKLMNQLILSEELEKKADLVYVNGKYNHTAEGKLFYQLRGAISEFEKSKIIERTSRGRREKARQGKVVRNYHIYGYEYDKNTDMLTVNESEANIVRRIFSMFVNQYGTNHGISGIAEYLNKSGIKTKKGCIWHRQVVRQILMNSTYTGLLYQNKWNSEGLCMNKYRAPEDRLSLRKRPEAEWIATKCPSIIDKDTFAQAQLLLGQSRRRYAGNAENRYLLSGLVSCGICGSIMNGRNSNYWGRHVLEYIERGTRSKDVKSCGNRIKAEFLDSLVWNCISGLISSNSFIRQEESIGGYKVNINCESYTASRYNTRYMAGIFYESETTSEDKQTLIRRYVSEIRVYKDKIIIVVF